jgi:hypothetical protein
MNARFAEAQRRLREASKCPTCGLPRLAINAAGYRQSFRAEPTCTCPETSVAGSHGHRWKGGRTTTGHGYVRVHRPDHPRANPHGYVYEHILVVEQALGHYLPLTAEVHHVDEDGLNNSPTNLVACEDRGYHKLLHQRLRALLACGDANAARCYFCQSYDRQDEIIRAPRPRDGKVYTRTYHRDCERAYHANRRGRIA